MSEKIYLKLYDGKDVYAAPSGTVMDAAKVAEKYPAASRFAYVVQTDAGGEMMYGFYSLSALRSRYGIGKELDKEQAVEAIAAAMEAEREAQAGDPTESTPEERTAAALEALVLNSMEAVNDDDPDAE